MRLPGIRYERPVQSLGRHDIMAPQRLAGIQAQTANLEGRGMEALAGGLAAVGQTLQDLEDQKAVEEYNTAWAFAQRDAFVAQARVNAGPMMPREGNPEVENVGYDFGTTTLDGRTGKVVQTERDAAPTWEVGPGVLQQRLDAIAEQYGGQLTTKKAQTKFARDFAVMRGRMEAKQIANAAAQRREFNEAKVTSAVEEFVRQGDERSAMAAVNQAAATGMISGPAALQLRDAIETGIDQNAVLNVIATGTDEELNAVIGSIGSQARMGFEEKKTLLNAAISERNRRNTAADKQEKEQQDAAESDLQARILRGEAGVSDVLTERESLSTDAERRLAGLVRTLEDRRRSRATEASTQTRGNLEVRIDSLANGFWPAGALSFEAAKSIVRQEILAQQDRLKGSDISVLLGKLQVMESPTFRLDPGQKADLDFVEEQGSLLIMRTSKSNIGLSTTGQDSALYMTFQKELHEYMRTMGNQARPSEWWAENEARFVTARSRRAIAKAARISGTETEQQVLDEIKRIRDLPSGDVETARRRARKVQELTERLEAIRAK